MSVIVEVHTVNEAEKALNFKRLIRDSNGIVISLAEHNGSYTSAFKNIYDWISVIEKVVWDDKPLFLLSASDGKRGGLTIPANLE